MNESNIREYAKLMDELGLTGLEVGDGADRLRLEKMPCPPLTAMPGIFPGHSQELASSFEEKDRAYMGYDEVISPMVGVFYSAPTENSEPYVKVGDKVRRGDTLCIIEAMKLMNEITAEEDGVIREICVSNGQVVEYGTVLFRMEK